VPGFAALLADREFYLATYPAVVARFALRGLEGSGLPGFERRNGTVPDDELVGAGLRVHDMAFLSGTAGRNSAPPSPSPASPTAGASS
jgi:hypothetical protein